MARPPPSRRWVESPVGVDTGIRLTTDDAAADHPTMLAAGVDLDPEVLRFLGGTPMFGFRDSDGNRLYISQRM